jgi:hypothetical protein
VVAGGGGGGGGREHIPLTNYQGGDGGAGGSPATAGFPGQGRTPGPGGCVGCGSGNDGGRGVSHTDNNDDEMGGGGGGGGGYTPPGSGNGGGGGGWLPSGNGAVFAGGGGAGGTSFAASSTSNPIFFTGPLTGSGVVTLSTVHQEGFQCTGVVQHPSFPAGVQYAHVTAEGAAGGTRSSSSNSGPPGRGGHGGIVSADLAGFAWENLNVFVGCRGSDEGGGAGYGHGSGGGKGTASSSAADDGAGGGGASAVESGEFQLVVAGGGGGGGGGAETFGESNSGGDGGDAGASARPGSGGGGDLGGSGGCPGSEWRQGIDGSRGEGSDTGGGAGGGGGGWGGGCGGEGGNLPGAGGGGGGAGGSYARPHSRAVKNAQYSTSSGVGTNGSVVFSYVVSTPTHLTIVGGSGQMTPIGSKFAQPLRAMVLDQNGNPLSGQTVAFAIEGAAGKPSGEFAGGDLDVSAVTDAAGIATSPALSANLETGSWQVEAATGEGVPPAQFNLTNTALSTATSVSSSSNPAIAGEQITFTATVKGPAGGLEPSGEVQFKSGAEDLGGPVTLPDGGIAQSLPTALPLGTHEIEAIFLPEEDFQTSSGRLSQLVEKETSATAVASSENPSGFGDPVTFTATVAPGAPGTQPPTGTVQFRVGGEPLGGAVPISGGQATSPAIDTLALGAHPVEAAYSGDEFVAASSGKLTQSVGADTTATEVSSAPNPSVFGQPVTYTATVKGQGADTPTGTVRFLLDGNQVCDTALANGSAGCRPGTSLGPGGHDVLVDYAGDADFSPSSGSATQVVGKAATQTGVTADLESSLFGQPVTFTAHVAVQAPGGGTPSGSVQFLLGDEPLGAPVALSEGTAVAPPVATLPVGVDAVTAQYLGDSDHSASSQTLFHSVAMGPTTTTVSSSANPTTFGVPVTFSAHIVPTAPASGEPTGTVRFAIDGKATCEVPVVSGAATCQAPTLFAGEHKVTAEFSGDADFVASGGALTQSVTKVASHTTASSSANPADTGETVTFTARVLGGLPGESPAGTVTFSDGSTSLGTAPVHATLPGQGAAAFETDGLSFGTHHVVATYSGDDAIDPSSAAPIAQTVNARASDLEPPTTHSSPRPSPASTCELRKVRARLFIYRSRDAIRLVARYLAPAPGEVTVRFRAGEGEPGLLGTLSRTFQKQDRLLRVVKKLPAKQMERLRREHHGFQVSVALKDAPGYCARSFSKDLSIRRLDSDQLVWFQADSSRHVLPDNSR